MSTSMLAVAVTASVLAVGPLVTPPLAAQVGGFVSPSQLFQPGTTFAKHEDWGSVCIWYGREPDGAVVYAWEGQQQCRGQAVAWGYDLNADARPEVYVWLNPSSNCGQQIRAWQWMTMVKWSEYVAGECGYSPDRAAVSVRVQLLQQPRENLLLHGVDLPESAEPPGIPSLHGRCADVQHQSIGCQSAVA